MGLLPLSHHRKQPSFPSSFTLQNPPLSPSAHQLYGEYCTYTPTTTTSFTSNIEPFSLPSSNYASTSTTSVSHSFYQNQDSMQQCYHPTRDNNMLMFGSEGSCSTSSDGSCTQGREIIKQEERIGCHSYNNNNDNFMLSHSNNINDGEKSCAAGEWFSQTLLAPLGYDIEDIKQLISSSSSTTIFNNVDENKTEEKAMYYYYY